jgi:hypothetical protein
MRSRLWRALVLAIASSLATAIAPAGAQTPISGAIFTTDATGQEVNLNVYAAATDVYLDGGPGLNAPPGAAGLPAGTYVFMVTDPSGKTLLSTDAAQCRQVDVNSSGIFVDVAPSAAAGCAHNTVADVNDPGGITVQLFPFSTTPNNGSEYKAWVTPFQFFQCPLTVVDCSAAGTKHGFAPAESKTDNFKLQQKNIREIDTTFFSDLNGNGSLDPGEPLLTGLSVTWIDTLGASNLKWVDPNIQFQAHVEAVETGTHEIVITNQPGCTVGLVQLDGADLAVGPQTVSISIPLNVKNVSHYVLVACTP